MEPRELDALVAEKVMGLAVSRPDPRSAMRALARIEPGYWAEVGHHSTEVGAAWQVVEAMKRLGYRLKLVEYTDGWYASFATKDIDRAQWHAAQVKAAPLAICLAALRALGIPIEGGD